MRVIALPAIGKAVPLGAYVAAVRRAKAAPDAEFRHGLTTWWPTTGREIVGQFRTGMQERINQAVPYMNRGNEHG